MYSSKYDIITRLEKDILPYQGLKVLATDNHPDLGFRPIENAFPNKCFPIGCMHEFINSSIEDVSATQGFVSAVLSRLMQMGGACLWISAGRTLFPAALKSFGIEPHQFVFIDLNSEKEVVYAMHEALKCNKLTAVLGEINYIDFKTSKKFQLAAEQSRVTGFILRHQPKTINTIACVSRWHITSIKSELEDGMPGVGFPRWHVELLKVRNGTPGKWNIEWSANGFTLLQENIKITGIEQLKMVV